MHGSDGVNGSRPGASSDKDSRSGTDTRILDPAPHHTPLWVVLSAWLLRVERRLQSRGGPRLRAGLRGFWALVAGLGLVLLIGPVINPPLTLDDLTAEASDVTDTWIARSFSADYTVSTDRDGRLVTEVEERIDAFFPKDLQDRTIERVLATEYQGHALDPSSITVTLDGEKQEIDRERAAVFLRLVVDPGAQLTGDHELVIRYTLSDLAYVASDPATGQRVDVLRWDVFGPDLQQAVAKLDVRVTIPQELDDRLIRQPLGTLAWTMIGAGSWLTPEADAPPGQVAYAFSSDDVAPPHAQARFTMPFEAGSITMPPQSWIFWLQTFGPVLPLLVLAATLLLSFAARAVAWGDARGRPWYVAQSEPPEGIPPRTAAHLLRSPTTMELAERLAYAAFSGSEEQARRARLIAAAGTARRTGRLGDRPRALLRYLTASERTAQIRAGLRRVPKGFVRDWFIAAPIALTLLQWGLVRQLSHQTVLAVVWWPVAFVLVSTLFAVVVLTIALTSRPLTRRGALLKQHLLGIRVFAERTQLLDRADLRDRLLPYAVLGAPPRATGRRVAALIAPEIAMPADAAEEVLNLDESRTGFLSGGRIAVRVFGVILVLGAIVAVAVLPAPTLEPDTPRSYSGDLPGSTLTTIASADIEAVLTQDGDRSGARLHMTERLGVDFSDEGAVPAQVVREWPSVVDGQDLGLRVDSVTIDGEDAPFTTEQADGRLLLRTTFDDVRTGLHDVVVETTATKPAVATTVDGRDVDRIRWVALLDGWASSVQWDEDTATEPFRFGFTVDDELLADAVDVGWIPAGATTWRATPDDAGDGRSTATLDVAPDTDGRWSYEVRGDDLGAILDLPAGTIAGTDPDAAAWAQATSRWPGLVAIGLSALSVLGSAIGLAGVVRRRSRRLPARPGLFRDTVRWLTPTTLAAALILGVWMLDGVAGDDPFSDLLLWALGAGLVAIIAWWAVARWAAKREAGNREAEKREA